MQGTADQVAVNSNSAGLTSLKLLKAFEAVAAGDRLCAAAASELRDDVTHAKQQFAAAAERYELAADLGCAAGMFNCAQLLRLGLADELLPDGTPAVAYQAAVRHLTNAMQQEQWIAMVMQPPHIALQVRQENVGVAECHVLAGDMQRNGTWGVDPASTQEALATYKKPESPTQHPAAQAAIGQLLWLSGNAKDGIEWYRLASNQGYSLGELGVARLLAEGAEADGHPVFLAQSDKETALDGAMLAAKHVLPRAKALAATLEPDRRKAAALLLQAVEGDGHPECLLVAARGYGQARYGLPK
jgi:TPR repeat protein